MADKEKITIKGIDEEMRQNIRNNSVAPLPHNVSDSDISAQQLQDMFVAPIIGENDSIISEFNKAVLEVEDVLNVFDKKIDEAIDQIVYGLGTKVYPTATDMENLTNIMSKANWDEKLDKSCWDEKVDKSGDTMTGPLKITMNGVTSSVGNQNSDFTHFYTTAIAGFHFGSDISVQRSICTDREVIGKQIIVNPEGEVFDQGQRVYSPNNPQPQAFDLIIRTQIEFEAMYNSPIWLGAASVAFVGDGGTLKFTKSDGRGIKIPQTVKQIQGFNNAIIEVTNFENDWATARVGIWYETLPSGNASSIKDLTVLRDSGQYGEGIAFYNCTNLSNCTGTGIGDDSENLGCGFYNCTNLINCIGIGNADSDQGDTNLGCGFRNCTNLSNCTATGSGTYYGGAGFHACINLNNCVGTGSGETFAGSGFCDCTKLSNCTGIGNSHYSGAGAGFRNCSGLSNCTGTGKGGLAANGFDTCTGLSSCTGTGIAIDYGYGFYGCSQLSNCRANEHCKTAVTGGTMTLVDTDSCDWTNPAQKEELEI